MADDFDFYGLLWAVEYCSEMLNAISDAHDSTDFGVDSEADYNKYLDKLYSLYDITIKNNVYDRIVEEMKEDDVYEGFFTDIKDEDDELKTYDAKEKLAESVEVGDYVRLYNGNCRYVCSRDGRNLWVTDKEADRTNSYARGWSADLYDIIEILERYEGED